MLEKVKKKLRFSHNLLDDEILETIKVARAEMIRSGIDEKVANAEDNALINSAIKTYCQYSFSEDEKLREGFWKSWEYQLDSLRKSTGYRREGGSDV